MVRSVDNVDPFVVVVGPTAAGKSELALRLCETLGGELVSCDSVQVYRKLDIGSAKPSSADQQRATHHLIDCVELNEDYDAGRYAREARDIVSRLQERSKVAVIAGGTGLYLRSFFGDQFHQDLPKNEDLRQRLKPKVTTQLYRILQRIDPARAAELHPNDRVRIERAVELRILLGHPIHDLPPVSSHVREQAFLIYLNPDPELLRERIRERTRQMLANGLVDETRVILESGIDPLAKPLRSIGYAQAVQHLQGAVSEGELAEAISVATSRYAKRQRTWFKKMNADLEINTLDYDFSAILPKVSAHLGR